MPSYKAPVEDVRFLLNDVFQMERYNNLPGFADASADVVDAILEEGARLCEEVRIDTNTLTRVLTLTGSSTATRRWITPSSSSFWIRRQQGVVDSPTFLAMSATASVAATSAASHSRAARRSAPALMSVPTRRWPSTSTPPPPPTSSSW